MLLRVFCIISAFIIANGHAQSVEETFPEERDTNSITTAVFEDKNSVLNDETCNEKLPECINTAGYCTSIPGGVALHCVCPEGTSYYTEAGCKVTDKLCDEKSPDCRKTKGFCILSGGDVSCFCPDNSVFLEGQGCYVPPEVCDAKIPICAKTGGTCIVEEETRNVICICPENLLFHETEGCQESKITEDECETQKPKCISTDGFCEQRNGKVECICPPETEYGKGGCKAVNFCVEVCGTSPGVQCFGNITNKEEVICRCRSKNEFYDSLSKECKVISTICDEEWKICRLSGGTCFSDANDRVKCRCPGNRPYRIDRGCSAANFCIEACGNKKGVDCVWDFQYKKEVLCLCRHKDEIYDSLFKECKVMTSVCSEKWPKCRITGGTCFTDADQNVKCKCPGEKQYKIETGCAVANVCVEVCGTERGVECIGNFTVKEDIVCICHRSDEIFDSVSKKCKVLAHVCNQEWPKCLTTNGTCFRDDDGNVECKCPGEKQYRIETGCAATVANFCVEVCGTKRGVQCIGDQKVKEKIRCVCSRKDDFYESNSKQCQVLAHVCNQEKPKCSITGGACFRDADDNIECKCSGKKQYRIDTGCSAGNFCAEECGTKRGVLCIGDVADKEKMDCACLSKNEIYDQHSKECRAFNCACDEAWPKCRITGGVCIREPMKKFKCRCPGGKQYKISTGCADACSIMPCLNGGTCFVYKDTFKCACDGTFTGERCQITKSDDAKKTNIVIWILCSIIIHLILIISCLAFSRCRSHMKEKNNC